MMKELFVPYEIALQLKEKEFDEPCFGYYRTYGSNKHYLGWMWRSMLERNRVIKAPLYEQVIDWFEEKHHLKIDVHHASSNGANKFTIWRWNSDNTLGEWERLGHIGTYSTKQEASVEAIKEALKLI